MRTTYRKKKKANWALRIVLLAAAAFLFFKLVQLHTQMEEKTQRIADMNESITMKQLIIEDLTEQVENANDDENQERQANDSGLYFPGQQVYQSSAG